ncbi:MAG: histidine kinase [Bacteroidota bacterium]|nr:histidine kinase [Bacteroidota bacterium]
MYFYKYILVKPISNLGKINFLTLPVQLVKTIAVVFSFLFFGNLFAQQPAYFILGENQFKGVQIYNVIQDNDLNYWFATNEGLYFFNHYTYEKIECDKAKSNSIFNFVMDSNGIIYCNNLNNQIFQIKNKTCSLFYELQTDEANSDISLAITANNNVLIGAKKIIELTQQGSVINRISIKGHYLSQAYTDKNQNTIYHLAGCDSVLIFSKNKISTRKIILLSGSIQKSDVLKFFRVKEVNYAINLKTKTLYKFNTETFELNELPKNEAFERSESIRLYSTGDLLWIAGTLPGTILLSEQLVSKKNTLFYQDYFISNIYKDREGNILLSTFDKGVLVIQDMQIPDVIHSCKDDPVTAIQYDAELGLLLGSSKGKLMSYKNETLELINDKGNRPIERLYNRSEFPLVLFDDGHIRAYNKESKSINVVYEASLKDAVIVSEKQFYLGTNRGIIKCNWDGGSTFDCQFLKQFAFRIYTLALNTISGNLYASTSNGLFKILPDGTGTEITYNKEAIFPNTLYYNNGKIYAADKKGGVLIIEESSVTAVIAPSVNEQPEVITKLIIHNNSIIAKSSKGLFQFDMSGKLMNALSTSQGFSSNRVVDFTIQDDQLWVSHTNGVQQINLNRLQQKITPANIRLSEIKINDSEVNAINRTNFSSSERKIQFILSAPTLRSRENIRYHYKLEGNDERWNINDYLSNQITYNALAPGSYTFFVKLENQNVFSDPVSYSFNISEPFYNRWWFIVCVVSLFVVLVLFIYRWQLNVQRKKSEQINELNASKLIAIQSQMNPHFIFNALNSIQDLVLKGDVEHSYSYITTFSNLVRRTLNYSEKDFIDFDQEIKLLELYLSLEKLRFKKELNYSIDFKNVEDIMLPPLLIQPFIENALIHGLLHKGGEKNLRITFELKEMLVCTIEDNGIGREKAKAIKLRQRSEHESFSGKAIHKRFEILSNVFEGKFGYVYEDLYQNEEATGTKVTLHIPIKRKF